MNYTFGHLLNLQISTDKLVARNGTSFYNAKKYNLYNKDCLRNELETSELLNDFITRTIVKNYSIKNYDPDNFFIKDCCGSDQIFSLAEELSAQYTI